MLTVLSINMEEVNTSWNFRKLSVHGQALEHPTSDFHKPSKVAWFSVRKIEFRSDFLMWTPCQRFSNISVWGTYKNSEAWTTSPGSLTHRVIFSQGVPDSNNSSL